MTHWNGFRLHTAIPPPPHHNHLHRNPPIAQLLLYKPHNKLPTQVSNSGMKVLQILGRRKALFG